MIRLLKLEYLKNFNYTPFKIFSWLYFIVLILLLFIGLVSFDFAGLEINLKKQGIYNFPGVWNFTTYIVDFLKIFLGFIIVFSITQEFSNRMFKQNVIDGLSREEFVLSKLLTILVFTLISTVLVFVIGLYLGKTYSVKQESNLVFQELYFIPNYFIKLFTFFCFLMFLSVLLRKSIFVFLALFIIWIGEGVLSGIERLLLLVKNSNIEESTNVLTNDTYITKYLPLESMSALIPSPLLRANFATIFGNQFSYNYPWDSLLACILWSVFFIYCSYFILKKRDW